MAETTVQRRRPRGEDAIYFAAAKNRYVGSVSLGYGPDGKRIRRKVLGKCPVSPNLVPVSVNLDQYGCVSR
jgi:hypothetical protein